MNNTQQILEALIDGVGGDESMFGVFDWHDNATEPSYEHAFILSSSAYQSNGEIGHFSLRFEHGNPLSDFYVQLHGNQDENAAEFAAAIGQAVADWLESQGVEQHIAKEREAISAMRVGYMGRNASGQLYGWITEESYPAPGRYTSVTEASQEFDDETKAVQWLQSKHPDLIKRQDERGDFVPYRPPQQQEGAAFLGEYIVDSDAMLPERIAFEAEIVNRVAASSRYTWALIKSEWEHDGKQCQSYKPYMSDGTGKVSPGNAYDIYDTPPSFELVKARMEHYEQLEAERKESNNRFIEGNKQAIAEKGLRPGIVFRDLAIHANYGHEKYSTVTIEQITDIGVLVASGVKRGSSKVHELKILPTNPDLPSCNRDMDIGLFASPVSHEAQNSLTGQAVLEACQKTYPDKQFQLIPFQLFGEESEHQIAFIHQDMCITDPWLSSCGRFQVDPLTAYGIGEKEAQLIAEFNGITVEQQTEQVGSSVGNTVQAVNTEKGRYAGPVIVVTDTYVAQDIGRNTVIRHQKEHLNTVPTVGKSVTVQYQQGKATVTDKEKSKSQGAGR